MMKAITVGITPLRRIFCQQRDAAESLRLIIDRVPANIAYFDTEMRYVFVNKAIEDMYGLSRRVSISRLQFAIPARACRKRCSNTRSSPFTQPRMLAGAAARN